MFGFPMELTVCSNKVKAYHSSTDILIFLDSKISLRDKRFQITAGAFLLVTSDILNWINCLLCLILTASNRRKHGLLLPIMAVVAFISGKFN